MAAAGSVTDIRRRRIVDALIARMAVTSGAPSWNGDDCKDFAAYPYLAALGVDPAKHLRQRWKTKREALRVLLESGHRSVLEACEAIAADLGWPRIDPVGAMDGDPGLAEIDGVQTCCVRHPSGLWVCRSQRGYACISDNLIVAAWRCV
jgi:hypothetical protein